MNAARDDRISNRIAYALERTPFLSGLIAGLHCRNATERIHYCVVPLAVWLPIGLDYLGEAAFIPCVVSYFKQPVPPVARILMCAGLH